MEKWKIQLPFHDPQQQIPVGRCTVCGREVYGVDGDCLYCQTFGT